MNTKQTWVTRKLLLLDDGQKVIEEVETESNEEAKKVADRMFDDPSANKERESVVIFEKAVSK